MSDDMQITIKSDVAKRLIEYMDIVGISSFSGAIHFLLQIENAVKKEGAVSQHRCTRDKVPLLIVYTEVSHLKYYVCPACGMGYSPKVFGEKDE